MLDNDQTNKTRAFALSYILNNISVIPTEFKGKKPIVKTWIPYKSERASPDLIKSWFSKPANIAVVTGDISDLAVIDIDSVNGYLQLIQAAEWLRKAPVVRSGRGYHIWISMWEYPNSISFELDGKLCHLKANGGLCTAPPSIHSNGNEYKFVEERSTFSNRPVVDLLELKKAIEKAGGKLNPHSAPDRPIEWASELFDNIGEGNRNDSAISLAGLLIRKFFYDPGLVLGLMEGWNEKFCKPPIESIELRRLVELALNRYTPRKEDN